MQKCHIKEIPHKCVQCVWGGLPYFPENDNQVFGAGYSQCQEFHALSEVKNAGFFTLLGLNQINIDIFHID